MDAESDQFLRRSPQRSKLERRESARQRRLRSVRQREDRDQGERQPRRRAGLDSVCRREQPRPDGSDVHSTELDRQQRQLLSRLRPSQFSRSGPAAVGRRRVRGVAEHQLRQLPAHDVLRSGRPERVGRAAVELGVLDERPAPADAEGVHQRRVLSTHHGQLHGARQRGAVRQRLPALHRDRSDRSADSQRRRDADGAVRPEGRGPQQERRQGRVPTRQPVPRIGTGSTSPSTGGSPTGSSSRAESAAAKP